ncbi:hypothetical protein DF3PB_10044 [uncultured Defluviicoccus sp.]|uniref:Bacteriophage lambda Replication protein O N-terminal domain-containing protein n=1 Tax=metagenome TaxID=256318 RepID=A0A380T882_9ZZZZ|nr:hypothetical protein DF3PB_10044 [uncultured Defluviicoccus sp.]
MTEEKLPRVSVLARQQISQHIDRYWMTRLTPPEFKVVRLVFDRTFAWGNWHEEISIRELVRGRRSYTDGTGLSQRTVFRCLQSLKDRAVLLAEARAGCRTTYALALDWNDNEERPIKPIEIDWGG